MQNRDLKQVSIGVKSKEIFLLDSIWFHIENGSNIYGEQLEIETSTSSK